MKIWETKDMVQVVVGTIATAENDKENLSQLESFLTKNKNICSSLFGALSWEPEENSSENKINPITTKLWGLWAENWAVYAIAKFCGEYPKYQTAIFNALTKTFKIWQKTRPQITIRAKK